LLPAVPLEVHAQRTGAGRRLKACPPKRHCVRHRVFEVRTKLAHLIGVQTRAASPSVLAPSQGLSVRPLGAFGTGSLGQVDRPLPDDLTRLTSTTALVSSFSDVPAGYPKGISSRHHRFVETRKGVPTNWAGTPDATHLNLCRGLAKGLFAKLPAKIDPPYRATASGRRQRGWGFPPSPLAPSSRKSPLD
jgi:hypothetical protein